ncbi:VanW family protein [Cytobacillus sp. FJAT-54145]|uniref:VanW family protein n=1 Tax=Cytobacillus spartinae TaxID=3299023 RepID=A0ABW6KA67_9BACI
MGKLKWIFFSLSMVCLLALTGCAEDEEKVEQLEKLEKLEEKVADLEKQIDTYQQKEEQWNKERAELKKEAEKPAVVNVFDPITNELVRTFMPAELGFLADSEKYKQEITNWARELARGTQTESGYDQRMVLDKIGADGKVIKGNPEVILEEAELVEQIMTASLKGGDVKLPLYVKESGYKQEEVPQLNEVVVASYTTYFNSGVAGRTKNIELSAEAINNVILGVGDAFSFNTTVGPSDAAHGYQPAEEIVNKKLVMGIGGGICQTSSTLYNAIDKLGVSYIEHHNHSLSVGYVPEGRDATVSYGGLDFRFENTTGVPLLIKAYTKNGSLTVEIRTSQANQGLL